MMETVRVNNWSTEAVKTTLYDILGIMVDTHHYKFVQTTEQLSGKESTCNAGDAG